MQVVAFASPAHPDWRWRIVNYAGEVVEESSRAFPLQEVPFCGHATIAAAVAVGAERLRQLDTPDTSRSSNPYRSTSYLRRS